MKLQVEELTVEFSSGGYRIRPLHGLSFVAEDGELGEIEILRDRDEGTEERLTVVTAGGYFGELGPMLKLPRSASARALGPTSLTGYPVQQFRAFQRQIPTIDGSPN